MKTDASDLAGFVGSLRSLGDGLLAAVQDRVELFALELEEEKFRLIKLNVWIGAAVFTGIRAVLFASLTLVYLFWESARLAVLGGLTVFYAVALLAVLIALRRFIAHQPHPLSATRRELEDDRTCIRSEN